jgi:glycosyltransferase involved in cell wall biosynthesis
LRTWGTDDRIKLVKDGLRRLETLSRMKNVLVIGPEGSATGGVAQYVRNQAKHHSPEITVTVHNTTSGSQFRSRLSYLLFALVALAKLCTRDAPDIVHIHSSHYFSFYLSSVYVLLVKLLWDCPTVFHVHGSSFDSFINNPVHAGVVSRVLDTVAVVVVLSEYWKERLSSVQPHSKIEVLPNAVDPGNYSRTHDPAETTVVFLSNLTERKGVNEFVAAVDELLSHDQPGSVSVEIAGKGPLDERVESLADAFSQVQYHGYVTEAEKHEILNRADVFVLPSYAEGLPIVILEAMAAGASIISTCVGSIPEVVGPENGILCEPGAADEVYRAISTLTRDRKRTVEMGEKNARLAAERYSWDVIAAQLEELYDTLDRGGVSS